MGPEDTKDVLKFKNEVKIMKQLKFRQELEDQMEDKKNKDYDNEVKERQQDA
jgi:hypothetical protein